MTNINAIIKGGCAEDGLVFFELPCHPQDGATAWHLGNLVHIHSQRLGAHNTPSAEHGNEILAHAKGKYGEIAFHNWLITLGLVISHTPFRDDYTQKVGDDDFIVNGHRLEIKSKMRTDASSFPPKPYYNVNLGKKGIEEAIHVFVEISGRDPLDRAPPALIVGWATPDLIRKKGEQTWPGKLSDNGRFTFKRHDWDIAISDLFDPFSLSSILKAA
ncbi:hypothetical protein KCP91_15845 [Microvirga sp. SRT01]|uniref:Restriction endonuclease n=1 Tax=Sphingomonas longa TaxID=2778730 RepID=A0ABS2DA91_9SPHN|nr:MULTISPECIES: hypothetical protein [Alphaproteobacteria]MBM6577857.1 hypothetical protein [Sphingomonas sp. BT552]MBR7710898.1 hypothetical protein [Microvirga sp. SRT01]